MAVGKNKVGKNKERKIRGKIMKKLALVLTVLFVFTAGQSWAKAPKPVKNDLIIKVVLAEQLPDFRWRYVLKMKKTAGKNSLPFVMGEFNNWQVQDLGFAPKTKKYYLLEISTFNREIAISYGGWSDKETPPEQWSWAAIKKSKFYDKERNLLVIGFLNGQLYKKDQAPFAPPPGEFGDDVIRFGADRNGFDLLTVYFNNNKVNGSVAKPFFQTNLYNWLLSNQLIVNSDGWGSAVVEIQFPLTLKIIFGGDHEADSWADISSSKFFYEDQKTGEQYLQFCFHQDRIMEKSEASPVTIIACKEVIHSEQVKLLSSQRLPDFRWQYKIGLSKFNIIGDRSSPFVMADVINGFEVTSINDVDGDGFYEVVIEAFNREITMTYGGNHTGSDQSKWVWADLGSSTYFDQGSKNLVVGLHEGQLYTKGKAPFAVPPGSQGDSFLSFSLDGNKLKIFFNNNNVNGPVDAPFFMLKGAVNPQVIINSHGWGSAVVEIQIPITLDITYGGNFAKNSWVGNVKNSKFYFKEEATGNEFFRVCVQ